MVAFAQYTAAAQNERSHLGQVVALLEAVPRWSLEPALGIQSTPRLDFQAAHVRLLTRLRASPSFE